MPNSTPATPEALPERLDRLARLEPTGLPFVSLYLDMRPDQHGRDNYEIFLRKAFAERVKSYKASSPERQSVERDVERIKDYLSENVERSANGLAIFACAGADEFFDAFQLDAPIENHWLFIGSVPHLYPLARVTDQYPRYAALLLDTNSARLFVFSLGRTESGEEVQNTKTRRSSMGGWSQARYQRHIENYHLQHIKEVAEVLERVVREEELERVVVAGDEVAVPQLREQLSQEVNDKVIDVVRLDMKAAEHEILAQTLDALREKDAEGDAETVREMLDAWRANGLAVAGPEATLRALSMGQVDELIIAASPDLLKKVNRLPDDAARGDVEAETSAANAQVDPERLKLADELVARAQQTGAGVRFIEDPELLSEVGGCGARLRFRV